MTATKNLLAFDLGAESGRGIVGQFDGRRLTLDVVHRFPNLPVRLLDCLHWDVLRLHGEILQGMRATAAKVGDVSSVGVDTWGVDFGLIGRDGSLLGNPRHYRDPHTEGVLEQAFAVVPREELFRQTGTQFMRFNSLFQLFALKRDHSPQLAAAQTLLFMPDLFHYFLTGLKFNEITNASTSQMLDPVGRSWAAGLVERFGLPSSILASLIKPGSVLGPLRPGVASDTGLPPIPVIAPATHDTGAAFAAVPARAGTWACISSGTWSLMGTETMEPQLDDRALSFNVTNEAGVGGTIRLLKNIMGLWLVQECRRTWERAGRAFSYEELMRLAEAATPFVSLIDPDHESFMLPANMVQAIGEFCKRTGQPVPTEPGPVVRCALESLAFKYRWVLRGLEELLGGRLNTIHVVGGGSQNTLLCQLTADACHRPVVAGPVEATAIGNVLTQALGLGLVSSLADAREVVRQSFDVKTYEPQSPGGWDEHFARFEKLLPAISS